MLLFLAGGIGVKAEDWPQDIFVSFENEPVVKSDQGFIQLKWKPKKETDQPITYHLQSSRAAIYNSPFGEARNLYQGPDRSSFVSGLPEGKTWFRVCAHVEGQPLGTWSDPVLVEVEYIETYKVVAGLAAGTAMLIFTVLFVTISHLRSKNQKVT